MTRSPRSLPVSSRSAPYALFVLVVVLVVGLLAGSAAASTPLQVDDAAIDYTDTDLTETAVALLLEDGALVVVLGDAAADSALPAIAFEVPDLDRTDMFGTNYNALLSDIDEVEAGRRLLSVQHPDADLAGAAAAYRSAFEALGFAVEELGSASGNVDTLYASGDAGEFRIRLQSTAGGVDASIRSL